jgi:UrcA family protein
MKFTTAVRSPSSVCVLLTSIIGVAFVPNAANAHPIPGTQALTEIVSYSDLNLNSPNGAKVLYGRLQNAAHKVCLPFESRDIERKIIWQKCFDQAIDEAVTQINKPTLTALRNDAVSKGTKG